VIDPVVQGVIIGQVAEPPLIHTGEQHHSHRRVGAGVRDHVQQLGDHRAHVLGVVDNQQHLRPHAGQGVDCGDQLGDTSQVSTHPIGGRTCPYEVGKGRRAPTRRG